MEGYLEVRDGSADCAAHSVDSQCIPISISPWFSTLVEFVDLSTSLKGTPLR